MATNYHPKGNMSELIEDLHREGYTYHKGQVNEEDGRFIFKSSMFPYFVDDLLDQGWRLVPGGIMEPPRESAKAGLARALCVGCLVFGVGMLINHITKES